jgi:hypothetical protein
MKGTCMNRTSRALKRLGVPVLTATTLLTAGQFALGTSAFAAVANGTLTITPNPGAGSATPVPPATGDIQQTVTYTPGTQSVNTGAQTITITVNGSATIVNPTPNTQPQSNPAPAQQNTLVIAGNGKSATCTTTTAPPNPNPAPAVVQGCNFAVHDILSEAVTVTATDSTDQTTPPATATDNFAALSFTGCATIPNTAPGGNCTDGGVTPPRRWAARRTWPSRKGEGTYDPEVVGTTDKKSHPRTTRAPVLKLTKEKTLWLMIRCRFHERV